MNTVIDIDQDTNEMTVILEESASSLTQGRPGPGSEGYYQTKH